MNSVMRRRVKLIRAIEAAGKTNPVIMEIAAKIRKDTVSLLAGSKLEDGRVSYTRHWNVTLDLNITSSPNMRTSITFGRYVRRNLGISSLKLSDKELDELTIAVKKAIISIDSLGMRIEILKGKDIMRFYENEKSSSCMCGSSSAPTEFYALNPEKVSLVVLDNSVRALLWTCDAVDRILDRVYPSACDGVHILREWATNKGYILRANPDQYIRNDKLLDFKTHFISMRHNNIFPYLDTFPYAKWDRDIITLSNDTTFGDCVLLETDGTISNSKICSSCGELVVEGEYVMSDMNEYYCDDCAAEFLIFCDDCEEYCSSDNMILINRHSSTERFVCEGCSANYTICDNCKSYYCTNDMTSISNGEEWCESCLEESAFRCESCHELFDNDELNILEGECCCEDCYDKSAVNCIECEETFHTENTTEVMHGGEITYICNNCDNDDYYYCEECHHNIHSDDAVVLSNTEDKHICLACLAKTSIMSLCDSCGTASCETSMIRVSSNEIKCQCKFCEDIDNNISRMGAYL